jgi:alpha-glucosidase (family GH31 glycosyl hydrolase)
VLGDMHFHDGETGQTMHNRYPLLYMRASREAIDAYERSHPHREIWFFNGFATDIGSYYGYTTPPTAKELFLRWSEWPR